jgi:hypothetical protein
MGISLSVNHRDQRVLNDAEIKAAIHQNCLMTNSLGYEQAITTLTTLIAEISEQKFYRIPFADYLPVVAGEGAWSSNLLTYRSYELAGDFNKGIQNVGSDNSRLARADAAVDAVVTYVHNWAKETGWSIMDMEMAAKAGNWDLLTAKEVSRKTNWDLGLQQVAFVGITGDANFPGLLTQTSVAGVPIAINTTTLTNSITSLAATPNTLSATIAQFLVDYRANCAHTAMPNRFAIPESDYLGLATASSPSFPLKTIMEYMLETFVTMTGNKDFKIMPLVYGDGTNPQAASANNQLYALYNADPRSIRMNVPVPYTVTLPNSLNNFNFSCVGYGTFSGVVALRPLEILYYQFPSSNLTPP